MPRYRKKPLVVEAYRTAEPRQIETPEGVIVQGNGGPLLHGVDHGDRHALAQTFGRPQHGQRRQAGHAQSIAH